MPRRWRRDRVVSTSSPTLFLTARAALTNATLTISVSGTNAGTAGDDLLQGTNAAESFFGGAGNDIIDALGAAMTSWMAGQVSTF